MDGDEYRDAIARLRLSQTKAAEFLGYDARTTRRWIKNQVPVPRPVAILLFLMVRLRMTADFVLSKMRKNP